MHQPIIRSSHVAFAGASAQLPPHSANQSGSSGRLSGLSGGSSGNASAGSIDIDEAERQAKENYRIHQLKSKNGGRLSTQEQNELETLLAIGKMRIPDPNTMSTSPFTGRTQNVGGYSLELVIPQQRKRSSPLNGGAPTFRPGSQPAELEAPVGEVSSQRAELEAPVGGVSSGRAELEAPVGGVSSHADGPLTQPIRPMEPFEGTVGEATYDGAAQLPPLHHQSAHRGLTANRFTTVEGRQSPSTALRWWGETPVQRSNRLPTASSDTRGQRLSLEGQEREVVFTGRHNAGRILPHLVGSMRAFMQTPMPAELEEVLSRVSNHAGGSLPQPIRPVGAFNRSAYGAPGEDYQMTRLKRMVDWLTAVEDPRSSLMAPIESSMQDLSPVPTASSATQREEPTQEGWEAMVAFADRLNVRSDEEIFEHDGGVWNASGITSRWRERRQSRAIMNGWFNQDGSHDAFNFVDPSSKFEVKRSIWQQEPRSPRYRCY